MRRREAGFTLLELILALTLSSIVLAALFGMMSSMFHFQVEGLKKSTVTGWSLASLMKMNKEIEEANVMAYPISTTPVDWFVGCTNWSRLGGGKSDASLNVTLFYYCYDTTTLNPQTGQPILALRRLAQNSMATTCPSNPVTLPACTAAWGGANRTNDVIAVGVRHHSSGALIFTRDDGVAGVRVRYLVGENIFTHVDGKPDVVNPQFTEFDTSIALSRSYLNTSD